MQDNEDISHQGTLRDRETRRWSQLRLPKTLHVTAAARELEKFARKCHMCSWSYSVRENICNRLIISIIILVTRFSEAVLISTNAIFLPHLYLNHLNAFLSHDNIQLAQLKSMNSMHLSHSSFDNYLWILKFQPSQFSINSVCLLTAWAFFAMHMYMFVFLFGQPKEIIKLSHIRLSAGVPQIPALKPGQEIRHETGVW